MWKLIALVLAKMIRVKYVGGVTLKNSLVLLLLDPHPQDSKSITVDEQITVEQLIEKRIIMRISRYDHVYRHHVRDK